MMKSGTMPRQRDICLAPFPFSDEDSEKKRPVLVISNSVFNSAHADVLVMAITSNMMASMDGIAIDSSDMDQGSLKVRSLILPCKIYALSSSRIERVVCWLGRQKFLQALEILLESISMGESACSTEGSGIPKCRANLDRRTLARAGSMNQSIRIGITM
ncbi:MAG: type II toxin-antitoxin system PemK/MazF family toxin [bacterium]